VGEVIEGGEQCGREASVHECVLLVSAATALLHSSGGTATGAMRRRVDVCKRVDGGRRGGGGGAEGT
jgi:hypothetical protein